MATLLSRPWVKTDSCIKTVQRHLDGVESIIVRQHFEMYRRAFVSGETNKTNLALFFRFIQRSQTPRRSWRIFARFKTAKTIDRRAASCAVSLYWNVDLSLAKRTRVTDRVAFFFSADFLNAFNHVVFNDPTLSMQDPASFGGDQQP